MQENQSKRTAKQNRALHKLLTQLSDELNDRGLYMMTVLKHDAEISWTMDATKQYLLKPFIKAMYGKQSTTELTTKELSAASEAMLDHVSKVTGVALEFPTVLDLMEKEKQ